MIDAEVRSLEQLLDEDDLGAAARRGPNQFFRARDVRVAVPTAGHLGGRYRYGAHERMLPQGIRGRRDCQKVGGELALTISHSSRPTLRKRCGSEQLK